MHTPAGCPGGTSSGLEMVMRMGPEIWRPPPDGGPRCAIFSAPSGAIQHIFSGSLCTQGMPEAHWGTFHPDISVSMLPSGPRI